MRLLSVAFSILLVLCSNTLVSAVLYTDATGDLHNGGGGGTDFSGFPHLDISSVEVTNTATDLAFSITLVGDIVATDWGKYMVGIDAVAAGDTSGNGWGRPISMPSGIDYWIGAWVDSGNGAELYSWDGSGWGSSSSISITKTSTTATITVPLADLGLSVGDTFQFDAYSSGGGGSDGAVDALSLATPSITNWGDPFTSTNLASYTVTAIPEPSAFLFGGLICGVLGVNFARNRQRAKSLSQN